MAFPLVTPRIQTGPRTPEASFEFDSAGSASEVTITHTGGDAVYGSNPQVLVDGDPASTQFSGELVAGDSITVDVSNVSSEAEVRVVWESHEGDASATLTMFRLP